MYITKKEGNTTFCKVPVGTEARITTTAEGPEAVSISWNMKISRLLGRFPTEEAYFWEYAPTRPACLEVYGRPNKECAINGIPRIVNQDKRFVVEWIVAEPLEITLVDNKIDLV
jgi:hypothetical protein